MANTKFQYVKRFEQNQTILPNTYVVIRVDGRAFHKLSEKYAFEKPNDRRALDLMNGAATATMLDIPDIRISYGVSDEYSFVLDRSTQLFGRRESKILTAVVSSFTAHYVHLWSTYFGNVLLSPPLPSFDGRVVAYPSMQNLRDYVSWRQADCHINNLYNTTFWALVSKGGLSPTEAEKQLKGTLSSDKHEILFSKFHINYNEELAIFRKGTINARMNQALIKANSGNGSGNEQTPVKMSGRSSATASESENSERKLTRICAQHCDVIKDDFWEENQHLF